MTVDTTAAQTLVALFVPLIVSLVKQEHWSNTINGAVAIAVYIAAGVIAVVTSGQPFDLNNVVPAVTIFVTVGTVAYTAFWKNTALEATLTSSGLVMRPTIPTTPLTPNGTSGPAAP